MLRLFQVTVLVCLVSVSTACPRPIPGPGPSSIIDCSAQAIRDNGIPLIPKVNDCLVSAAAGNWMGCLISLIDPVAHITEDVLACVVQSSWLSYAAAADANAGDSVSSTGAQRAKQFLRDKDYKFK